MINDPADCILNTAICALRDLFAPDSAHAPLGGGTTHVRAFAGEVLPIEAFTFHTNDPECGCDTPLVWVRLMRRYRSQNFPQPALDLTACGFPRVGAVEIGVARCASMELENCSWTTYEAEAEVSLDDSWRIERALCVIATRLRDNGCSDAVATDAVLPYGPDGGVVGWTGTFYARMDT